MKRIILVISLLLMNVCVVNAETIDSKAQGLWDNISSADNFHLFDNLTPATFYDVKSNQWFTGGVTSVYSYKHFAIDLGGIKSMSESGHIIPMAGLNIGIGSFINSYEQLKNLISSFVPSKSLIEQLTIGGWISRDFEIAVMRYGLYAGVEIKF